MIEQRHCAANLLNARHKYKFDLLTRSEASRFKPLSFIRHTSLWLKSDAKLAKRSFALGNHILISSFCTVSPAFLQFYCQNSATVRRNYCPLVDIFRGKAEGNQYFRVFSRVNNPIPCEMVRRGVRNRAFSLRKLKLARPFWEAGPA